MISSRIIELYIIYDDKSLLIIYGNHSTAPNLMVSINGGTSQSPIFVGFSRSQKQSMLIPMIPSMIPYNPYISWFIPYIFHKVNPNLMISSSEPLPAALRPRRPFPAPRRCPAEPGAGAGPRSARRPAGRGTLGKKKHGRLG